MDGWHAMTNEPENQSRFLPTCGSSQPPSQPRCWMKRWKVSRPSIQSWLPGIANAVGPPYAASASAAAHALRRNSVRIYVRPECSRMKPDYPHLWSRTRRLRLPTVTGHTEEHTCCQGLHR